jgi:hypothetical protein
MQIRKQIKNDAKKHGHAILLKKKLNLIYFSFCQLFEWRYEHCHHWARSHAPTLNGPRKITNLNSLLLLLPIKMDKIFTRI